MIAEFKIDTQSSTPKYQQIMDQFLILRERGLLKSGDQLASIGQLAKSQKLALATVANAYDRLKEMGLVESRHGKGFFVTRQEDAATLNVFVLFDTLNPYKDILLKSFIKGLPDTANINLNFYHYNADIFKRLIRESHGKYTHYVILPHLNKDVSEILNKIPSEKLILLDRLPKGIQGNFSAVYHDFEKVVVQSLNKALPFLSKYNGLDVVLDLEHGIYIPDELVRGIMTFTKKNNVKSNIIRQYSDEQIQKGKAYLIFSENDLVNFIKRCKKKHWKIGEDIGLISYDDTPIKEILLNGVTVISTDFALMGKTAAALIVENKRAVIENKSGLFLRHTL